MEYLTPTHQEIVNTLRQANVAVIVNNHKVCRTNKYDGYAMSWRNPNNNLKKTVLLMCNNTVKRNYNDWVGELNRTLAHESVHVAQMCKSNDGYIRPLGFRKDIESEAFAIQDNPREVLRILKKYCL